MFESPDESPGSCRRHREKSIFNFSVMPLNEMESQCSRDISIITEEARNNPRVRWKNLNIKGRFEIKFSEKIVESLAGIMKVTVLGEQSALENSRAETNENK